ncbi:MAG TPA: YidC/Oxa1 family membrane protein insertase [Candidatus Paceibacterota bacterium]
MTHGFFTTVFSQPLYNGLVFLITLMPAADAGIAIIIFTILVRLVLYPLSKGSILTQMKLKSVEGEIALIKETIKDKTAQAAKIMGFYKEKGLNPLSGFVLILVQIPIIFALYHIFLKSGLPIVDTSLLYSFITAPQSINMHFLGLLDISEKSYLLAFICAVSQYFQARLALPPAKPRQSNQTESFKDNLARSMNMQMRYFFPIVVFFIVYSLSGTIALYWITTNVFSIAQEWYVRRNFK